MGIMSIFKPNKKYFSKTIPPKCDYCHFGKRAKSGNKVLCEKSGLVDCTYSCGKFVYSPLKRIPVKQLKFAGSLADEDIYIESAYEKRQKEAEQAKIKQKEEEKNNNNPEPAEKKSKPVSKTNQQQEEDINIDSIETYHTDTNQYEDDEQDEIIHN